MSTYSRFKMKIICSLVVLIACLALYTSASSVAHATSASITISRSSTTSTTQVMVSGRPVCRPLTLAAQAICDSPPGVPPLRVRRAACILRNVLPRPGTYERGRLDDPSLDGFNVHRRYHRLAAQLLADTTAD